MRFRLLGLVALMALVIASCGGTSPEAGGPSEGIQVHGDWTIDIYNEDGSLDRSVEFENALTEDGHRTLALALAFGSEVSDAVDISGWQIVLGGVSQLIPLSPAPCSSEYPLFGEPRNPFDPENPDAFVSGACFVDADASIGASPDFAVLISGSTVAEQAGTINFVETVRRFEDPDRAAIERWAITRKTSGDPLPISIEAGQNIQVEVTISFTSG